MDERARRVGENEALFRAVNEQVHGVNESFAVVGEALTIVCECGRSECMERLELAMAEYEALRAEPTHFAFVPGHEEPDVETVVERRSGYWIVQKRAGGPASLARDTDPRS